MYVGPPRNCGGFSFTPKVKGGFAFDKVLMVYAIREGWYKETPDQNVLLLYDALCIVIQLLAWGDIAVAQRILPEHKTRRYTDIQERLEFEGQAALLCGHCVLPPFQGRHHGGGIVGDGTHRDRLRAKGLLSCTCLTVLSHKWRDYNRQWSILNNSPNRASQRSWATMSHSLLPQSA
jgi:hypothetical protein